MRPCLDRDPGACFYVVFEPWRVKGARLVPLFELRNRMEELDRNKQYIVYCHGGSRSAVAALILAQNQFEVLSLDGGIRSWPFETQSIYDRQIVMEGRETEAA